MNEVNEEKIDALFSQSLGQPNIPFVQADWIAMKEKLAKDKKRRGFIWWAGASGIAAALLVSIAWWGLDLNHTPPTTKFAKTPVVKEIEPSELPKQKSKGNIDKSELADLDASQPTEQIQTAGSKYRNSAIAKDKAATTRKKAMSYSRIIENNIPEKGARPVASAQTNVDKDIVPVTNTAVIGQPIAIATNSTEAALASKPNNPDSLRVIAKVPAAFKPSFIISFTGAPDVSAVKSFSNNKISFSGGLLATMTLSPKLSITSGAILAKKLYQTGFENYNPTNGYKWMTNPLSVSADCRVLDIPLNVNYIVFQKNKGALQLTAGASSYFMLTEKYSYKYANPYSKGPQSFQFRNSNNYYFGVANIAIAYQRQLNDKTNISIQPYLKLPLTNIGYGNIKLISTGVSLNLNMNLSAILKQK